jgi:ABC-type nitrate/sulfonate/bicarbonate transport system substrate-binding protein
MNRFAAILSAALLLVPCAAAAQPSPKAPITIHVGAIPSEVAAELFYGVDMGFFKKAGLDVQIDFFNNGAAIAAAT